MKTPIIRRHSKAKKTTKVYQKLRKKSPQTINNLSIELEQQPQESSNVAVISHDLTLEQCSLIRSYQMHLSTVVKNPKTNEPRRICKLLNHTYYLAREKKLPVDEVEKWSHELLSKRTDLLIQYVQFLKTHYRHKGATILNFCNVALDSYLEWFTLVRDNCTTYLKIKRCQIQRFAQTCAIIRKSARKEMKSKKFKKTKKHRIAERKLPSGDQMLVLKNAIRSRISWAREIEKNPQFINETTYTNFLQVMFASMWMSPQGRIGAFILLMVQDYMDLMKSYIEGFNFKTASTYGVQPIILNPRARYDNC